jgi:GxxExxY protein
VANDLLLKDEVYAMIGAAIEVHRELGSGVLEPVYHEAMEIELQSRDIPFETRQTLHITYKGRQLDKTKSYAVASTAFPPPPAPPARGGE